MEQDTCTGRIQDVLNPSCARVLFHGQYGQDVLNPSCARVLFHGQWHAQDEIVASFLDIFVFI